ncbi:MAG: methyltransferase domain-containing protein [Chloroflexia bacterium]|nr:methyltransferase domain-containing protein [Chloroflexia bacterium]
MKIPLGWQAAGFDWLDIWRDMYDQERAQGDATTHPDMQQSADQYATAATRFARNAKRVPQPDAFMQWLLPQLNHGDRVLDIGAGSGRYLPPLTAAGCQVIALEQSPAMRAQIELLVQTASLPSVTTIADTWPMMQVPACTVAMAVHVLYAVRDIAPFLRAMDAAASKLCVLVLGLRHPTTAVLPLWQAWHGEPRLPLPAAHECMAALAQLGIAANLTVLPVTTPLMYASVDEAVVEMCARLRVPYDDFHQQQLAALIAREWQIRASGEVVVPLLPPPNCVIWWHPTQTTVV